MPFTIGAEVLRDRADVADFRALMSAFPTGVAIVTSVDADGQPRGLTCSSLSSVTLSPPTLLVCLRNGGGTLDALMSSGVFAVNILHTEGQGAAEMFAEPRSDRFDRLSWQLTDVVNMPLLSEVTLAVAECVVSNTVTVGDHTVVFGEVLAITQHDGTPLLYGLRRYIRLPRAEPVVS